MGEMLREFVDSRGVDVRVDREAAVIRRVKILGMESRNGRRYLPEALASAVGLYEGVKVNVNHPKGDPRAPRDYQDRIGVLRRVELRGGEGLLGDLHFNPKHALAEQLMWDAEHAPENVGFSHNVQARTSREGERLVVEEIVKVESVDLVATRRRRRLPGVGRRGRRRQGDSRGFAKADSEPIRESRPDLVAELERGLRRELDRLREEVATWRRQEGNAPRSREQRWTEVTEETWLPDAAAFARSIR